MDTQELWESPEMGVHLPKSRPPYPATFRAESSFGTLKAERIDRYTWPNGGAARQAIFAWLGVFYNRQRRHSALGYVSPVRFEGGQREATAALPAAVHETGASSPLPPNLSPSPWYGRTTVVELPTHLRGGAVRSLIPHRSVLPRPGCSPLVPTSNTPVTRYPLPPPTPYSPISITRSAKRSMK
jgi:hypothetical protein